MPDFNGPLFDGQVDRLAADMAEEIGRDLGEEGAEMVRAELPNVLQRPTGRYLSGIRSEPVGAGSDVTDGGIVYGPWLEGVSRRNRETRFKGYATFRRVAIALEGRALRLTDPIVQAYVRRMG